MSLLIILLSCACKESDTQRVLSVWVYSEEYKKIVEYAVNNSGTNFAVPLDITVVESSKLSEQLALAEQNDLLPDVVMLSPDNMGKFINSDSSLPLSDSDLSSGLSAVEQEDYYSYALDLGRDYGGNLKALCMNFDPGIFLYRRSMAKAYFGTDSPELVSAMLSSWDSFLGTAELVKLSSDGKTRIVAGHEDLIRPFFSSGFGWVNKSGDLSVPAAAADYLDFAEVMTEREYSYSAAQWSQAWLAGMNDPQAVFGYFLSGMGIKYILEPACNEKDGSFGDWAAVAGPSPYSWSGAWLSIHSKSDMKKESAELLRLLTADGDTVEKHCRYSRLFSARRDTAERIKSNSQFQAPVLAGQNYYEVMYDSAARMNTAKGATEYDSIVRAALYDCANSVTSGQKSRADALMEFSATVKAAVSAGE
jgi:maltose-binding protein MalE